MEDNPAYINYPGENGRVQYGEGIFVGYRYYEKKRIAPLFPFGFGLSYTSFTFSHLHVLKPYTQDHVKVSLDVANTGSVAGAEVVQVYVGSPALADEPPHQLKAFAKVSLAPHETQRVSLVLDARSFSIWDADAKGWRIIPGQYKIFVGDSSRDLPLHQMIRITMK